MLRRWKSHIAIMAQADQVCHPVRSKRSPVMVGAIRTSVTTAGAAAKIMLYAERLEQEPQAQADSQGRRMARERRKRITPKPW